MNIIRKLVIFSKNKEALDSLKIIFMESTKKFIHLPIRPGDLVIGSLLYFSYAIPMYIFRNLSLEANRVTNRKEFRPTFFTVK